MHNNDDTDICVRYEIAYNIIYLGTYNFPYTRSRYIYNMTRFILL